MARPASSRPDSPGMTTSVTSTSRGPGGDWTAARAPRAGRPEPRPCSRPAASTRRAASRTVVSSSTSRTVPRRSPPGARTAVARVDALANLDPREVELERGAQAGLRVEPDVPAGLAHDAVAPWRARAPCPCRPSLVVKNGSKTCCARLAVHALPGVAHREHDVGRPAATSKCSTAYGSSKIDVAGRDRDGAAAGHRVARVDHEVHEDLVELRRRRAGPCRSPGQDRRTSRTCSPMSRRSIGSTWRTAALRSTNLRAARPGAG